MMKIAFIHNNFPSGGAERVTVDIARYLDSCGGYQVYVYASRIAQALVTEELSGCLTLRQIPTQAVPSRRAKKIEEYILQDGIDILVQVTKAIPGIEQIKEKTGVKTVVACHGEPLWQRHAIVYRRQKGFLRKLMWKLYNRKRYEDGTLARRKAVTRTMRDYATSNAYTVLCQPYKMEMASSLGLSPDKSHIYAIENPESPVQTVNYDKEKIVLFCGRFENWSKRIDRLLRIWSKVQDRMPEWRLVLVGDGEDWQWLRQMALDMSLERVSFEGRTNDVASYYRRASVVALTSETEGWPLALTEAQAQGCICVAFGCTSGVKEVLSPDGECGFVVPAFDEQKFADTLCTIAGMDEESRLRIRRNSVARRLEYAPEIISEKWRLLFDELYIGKNNGKHEGV
jgi:glycosyltransferase involved in cell wall biosynthesis